MRGRHSEVGPEELGPYNHGKDDINMAFRKGEELSIVRSSFTEIVAFQIFSSK